MEIVIALSNASGQLVESYRYDVYGRSDSVSFVGNPYLFTGRQYDPETGLYYYRARYYKPSIGRFLQTDPVGYSAGINWYAYCGNNPIILIDSYGLCAQGSGFWGGVAWTSGQGAQLIANTFQGLQDMAIGNVNFITGSIGSVGMYGEPMGRHTVFPEIPSPQWAQGLYVEQSNFVYNAEKIVTSLAVTWGVAELASMTSSAPTATTSYEQLVSEARQAYPNKAGIPENHHITPQYLGGAKNGPTVKIDAAYHQQITNEFKSLAPYGQAEPPSPAQLQKFMNDVYSKYPLPR
jgi:RHS repeat-associated protein